MLPFQKAASSKLLYKYYLSKISFRLNI